MENILSNKNIIEFLKLEYRETDFIDSLKIKYRSLICPFIDLIKIVQPGEKVGDVGCGSGQFLLLLSHFAKPEYLLGIEISQKLINNANLLFNKLPKNSYKFLEYDGMNFPIEISDLDIIYLIDVLHHVPKIHQNKFLKDLINAMKPGSRIVLKDINADSPLVFFNKLHDLIFAKEIGNEISMKKAILLLKESGLSIIEQNKRTMYVYPHYTIIAKK